MAKEIVLRAPATSANLGPGFDILGMALNGLHDDFHFSRANKWRVSNLGSFQAAAHPEDSVFAFVWKAMKREFRLPGSLDIKAFKRIKPRAGMGSSATEAAATAFAVNKLFNLRLSKDRLVHFAGIGESFAAKEPHYDNVGPAIHGGVVVLRGTQPVRIQRYNPGNLDYMLVINSREKASTAAARAAIPDLVPKKAAFNNQAGTARLLMALIDGHHKRKGHEREYIKSLRGDQIVEPARSAAGILPHLTELSGIAERHGYSANASGAGPTLIVTAKHPIGAKNKKRFEREVKELFDRHGITTELHWMRASRKGVHEIPKLKFGK